MDSIVILDDDDEEASTSASCSKALNCQPRTNQKKPQPTHITQSPFASAKKDTRVLQLENEKLFAEVCLLCFTQVDVFCHIINVLDFLDDSCPTSTPLPIAPG